MKIMNGNSYDIVVCGSGSAGFCAAIQAARAGCKTAIVEKTGMSGGVMTTMGNNQVAQFNANKKQIIRGIGWEFIERLADRGYASIPDFTMEGVPHWRFGVDVNIVAAAKLMDEMLIESNVDIYYHQPVVDVETDITKQQTTVKSIIITTKSGLKRISGKVFIDCTGDGDICAWAGAKYKCGDPDTGELQPGTIRFFMSGTLKDDAVTKRINISLADHKNSGELLEEDYNNHPIESLMDANGNNVNHISYFNGADSDSKSKAEIQGRESVYRVLQAVRNASDKTISIPYCIPEVAVRESRRILCDSYITMEDYIHGKKYEDAICYSYYLVDLHKSGNGGIFQINVDEGVVPQIPLSALLPTGLNNVLVAGRCVSGDRNANSAYRVKASCMAMGQAAGATAAVAVAENMGIIRGVDIAKIKQILIKDDAIVPGEANDPMLEKD